MIASLFLQVFQHKKPVDTLMKEIRYDRKNISSLNTSLPLPVRFDLSNLGNGMVRRENKAYGGLKKYSS